MSSQNVFYWDGAEHRTIFSRKKEDLQNINYSDDYFSGCVHQVQHRGGWFVGQALRRPVMTFPLRRKSSLFKKISARNGPWNLLT